MQQRRPVVVVSTFILCLAAVVLPGTTQGAAANVPEEWKTLKADGLTALARNLHAQGSNAAQERALLVAYLGETYLADSDTTRSVAPKTWREWGRCLKAEMASDTRASWRGALRMAFAAPSLMGSLKAEDAMPLAWTLKDLGDEQLPAFFVSWMTAGADWKAIQHPGDWGWLTQNLSRGGEAAKPLRTQLAQHMTETYLAAPEATRSLGPWAWSEMGRTLSWLLPNERRTAWVTGLQQAYADPGALKPDEQLSLAWAYRYLHAGAPCRTVLVTWMSGCDDWKTMKPDSLAWLGQNLAATGEAAADLRGRLATHVTAKYTGTAEKAAKAGCWAWSELARTLQENLTEAGRQAWAENLHAAYGGQKLTNLKPKDQVSLAWAFHHLKQAADCAQVLGAWMAGSDAWKSADGSALTWLAENLAKGGDATKAYRDQLTQHVTQTRVADPQATRTVGCHGWSRLAFLFSASLDSGARQAWAAGLRTAYGGNLDSLKPDEQLSLAWAYRYLGDNPGAGQALAAWMSGSEAWKSANPGLLRWLAQELRHGGEDATAERRQLATHVGRAYMGSAKAARQVTCGQWSEFALALGGTLEAETRRQWTSTLRQAYAQNESLGAMTFDEQLSLAWAFRYLGAGDDARQVLVAWMSGGEAWKSESPEMLAWLAQNLGHAGDDAKGLRGQLAAHLAENYLTAAENIRKGNCWAWSELARNLTRDLNWQSRKAWAERLREAYAGAKTLASLDLDEALALAAALDHLRAGPAWEVLLPYMENTDWRSLRTGDLCRLARGLNRLGAPAMENRLALAQHVRASYAASTETVRSVPIDDWAAFTRCGEDMPKADRHAWAQQLQTALGGDTASLLEMGAADVGALAQVLQPLDRQRAVALAHEWMTRSPHVTEASMQGLWHVAKNAVSHHAEDGSGRNTVPDVFEEAVSRMPDEAKATYDHYLWLLCQWNHVGNTAKVKEWALKAHDVFLGSEAARQEVPMGVIENLAMWFHNAHIVGEGKGYPTFAAAMAGHARRGTLGAKEPKWLAGVLGTPETQQMLRAELLNAQGVPRIEVARILAMAYRPSEAFGEWRTWLDQQLATSRTQTDAKAHWLLVRAYTEAVVVSPPNLLRGREWLDQALKTATTTPTRLHALHELVAGHLSVQRYDRARQCLDENTPRFDETSAADDIGKLRDAISLAETRDEAEQRRAAHRADLLHREELQQRLRAAREQGNAEAVTRYERLLGQAE